MHEYELKGLFIGLILIALMGMGLEIAKHGGLKNFFKYYFAEVISWLKKGIS